MKKLLIVILLFVLAVPAFAEVFYKMSQKDYLDLCSKIAASKTDWSITGNTSHYLKWCVLENVKNKLERHDTEDRYLFGTHEILSNKISRLEDRMDLFEMKMIGK